MIDILNDKKIYEFFWPNALVAAGTLFEKDSLNNGTISVRQAYAAYYVLLAMQQPIREGERFLIGNGDSWSEQIAKGMTIELKFHPNYLRLPDKFQPAKHSHASTSMAGPCPQCHEMVVWRVDEGAKPDENTHREKLEKDVNKRFCEDEDNIQNKIVALAYTVSDWLGNGPQKTYQEIDHKLWAFVDNVRRIVSNKL